LVAVFGEEERKGFGGLILDKLKVEFSMCHVQVKKHLPFIDNFLIFKAQTLIMFKILSAFVFHLNIERCPIEN
jgi:hypothetical protein